MLYFTSCLFSPQIAYSSSSPGNYAVSVPPRTPVPPRAINYLSRTVSNARHSLLFSLSPSSPLRAPQGEAARQELPSCRAPEVSCGFYFYPAFRSKNKPSLCEIHIPLRERRAARNWVFSNGFSQRKNIARLKYCNSGTCSEKVGRLICK